MNLHSEMGPVRQNPTQRTVKCVHFTVHIVAHNIAQNRSDNFPSYPPDNHHCSDDVYLRERGNKSTNITCGMFVNKATDEQDNPLQQ